MREATGAVLSASERLRLPGLGEGALGPRTASRRRSTAADDWEPMATAIRVHVGDEQVIFRIQQEDRS